MEKESFVKKVGESFTPQQGLSTKIYTTIGLFSFILIIVTWTIMSAFELVNPVFLPSALKTIRAGIVLFAKGYVTDIGVTTIRVFMGFLVSIVVAVPLGILIGTYSPIEALIEPVMSFVRYLPVTAFIPLFILWIGIDESEKIAVIIMGSLPQLILMVAVDTKKVQHDLIEVSYTLGTSKTNVIWKIIFPAAMPSILDSLRMVLGWAWTYVTVAEMIGASSGIGFMIIQSQRMMSVANIFVGILSIGIIGLVFDCIFKWLGKVLFPWN